MKNNNNNNNIITRRSWMNHGRMKWEVRKFTIITCCLYKCMVCSINCLSVAHIILFIQFNAFSICRDLLCIVVEREWKFLATLHTCKMWEKYFYNSLLIQLFIIVFFLVDKVLIDIVVYIGNCLLFSFLGFRIFE